jgi:Exostosin family
VIDQFLTMQPTDRPSIKIHSDRQFLKPDYPPTVMLYPFWGKEQEDPRNPRTGRYDHYAETGAAYFEWSSLEAADLVIVPVAWQYALKDSAQKQLAWQLIRRARAAGKPAVVFYQSDFDFPLGLGDTLIFRTSLVASRRQPHEFVLPAWHEDFVPRYFNGQLPLRTKSELPSVGFCGLSKPIEATLTQKLKEWLIDEEKLTGIKIGNLGSVVRARALRVLLNSSLVKTHYMIHPGFIGGAQQKGGRFDFEKFYQVRQDYIQNICDSDYILCCRGLGNFSARFYEVLSSGRIPVFVNTNCALPYDFMLDYKQYMVWVEEREIPYIDQKIAEFHANLSPQAFIDLQYKCRQLWEQYLTPTGFFANFHRHFHPNGQLDQTPTGNPQTLEISTGRRS